MCQSHHAQEHAIEHTIMHMPQLHGLLLSKHHVHQIRSLYLVRVGASATLMCLLIANLATLLSPMRLVWLLQAQVVVQGFFGQEQGQEVARASLARETALEVARANVEDDSFFNAVDGCLEGQVPNLGQR